MSWILLEALRFLELDHTKIVCFFFFFLNYKYLCFFILLIYKHDFAPDLLFFFC